MDWEDVAICAGIVVGVSAVGYCAYRAGQEWSKQAEKKDLARQLKALIPPPPPMPPITQAELQALIHTSVASEFEQLKAALQQYSTPQQPQPQSALPTNGPVIVSQLTDEEWGHLEGLSNERLRGLLKNISPNQSIPHQESKRELLARLRAIEPFVIGASNMLRQALTFTPAQPVIQPQPQQQPQAQPQPQAQQPQQPQEVSVSNGGESIQVPLIDTSPA